MLQIPTKTKPAYNAGNILTLNQKSQCLASPVAPAKHSTPQLRNLIQKGQKVRIGMVGQLPRLRVALGWNVSNLQCDIDLSAYLLDASGKVPGDDWFVFYGQTSSPNKSVTLHMSPLLTVNMQTLIFSDLILPFARLFLSSRSMRLWSEI